MNQGTAEAVPVEPAGPVQHEAGCDGRREGGKVKSKVRFFFCRVEKGGAWRRGRGGGGGGTRGHKVTTTRRKGELEGERERGAWQGGFERGV